jgi:hypothetical protein
MRLLPIRTLVVLAFAALAVVILTGQSRLAEPLPAFENVLPALAYGPSCSTGIELRNLSDRPVTVEIEGHRASGALVGLAGVPGNNVRIPERTRQIYRLEIPEETTSAWAKIRERGPPGSAPAIAVAASSECIAGDQVRSVRRDVAFPQNNPWFDSDASPFAGGLVSMINTSARSTVAYLCYSSGNLFSVPGRGQRGGDLAPICSAAFDLQIPPFGAREFPVERPGSTHFTLRTVGRGIVLEMLRPIDASVRIYSVDSTIRFDGDAAAGPAKR